MTIYYKGAHIGSYWHAHDARISGFYPVEPGAPASTDRIINHISESNFTTPYVSLTASYSVAFAYALYGRNFPVSRSPAYIYEIEIESHDGSNIVVLDPIRELSNNFGPPPSVVPYHHEGDQEFLLGVVSPYKYKECRMRPKRLPPGSHDLSDPANVSKQLRAITFSLRDAEVLVFGAVPKSCVTGRYDITLDQI